MSRRFGVVAMLALGGVVGLANQAALANCVNEGPYEVRQCSKGAWFAPKPAGAGTVSAAWWGIGFGNGGQATGASQEGSGFVGVPLPGVFIGVDNGTLNATQLDLVDASTAGIGAPAGTLCFSASANWGSPGIDSCIDINRTDSAGGGGNNVSDNTVNRYWDTAPNSYGYEYFNHQLDPPMGVLLTEASGQYFAAAFFASIPKQAPRSENPDLGQYSLGDVSNGDAGPFGNNIVPWQAVPQPSYSTALSVPSDPHSPRIVTMSWSPVRFIHDNSTRPCLLTDGTTPCPSLAPVLGVGVNDQGALIHHVMESTALDGSGNCGSSWTAVAGSAVDYPATGTVGAGVAEQSCVRLKTSFGKTPVATYQAAPADSITRDNNRLAAQTGKLGDLGYSVASTPRKIGGALVSQKATLKLAVREKGTNLHVAFDTDTELNITGFDVVGIDNKGGRKVIGTVSCKQCTSGLSASYDEVLSGAKLQGAKQVQIVIQPAGTQSNTLDVK